MSAKEMFRADLHCHSTCSDGSLTPEELVRHAHRVGLQALSITDHDTVSAYETAIPEADRLGLILGTGVEFSCSYRGVNVHVLGYDFTIDEPMRAFCLRHQQWRTLRNRRILAKLQQRGFFITEEELGARVVGRLHMALALVKKGAVRTVREAFEQYLGDGKSCSDSEDPMAVEEAIAALHISGGKAFLAHPHLFSRSAVVKGLLTLPFDGIECYYANSSPTQESRWLKIARAKQWLVSGGSDFHGALKPHNPLGSSWVNEELFRTIFTGSLAAARCSLS